MRRDRIGTHVSLNIRRAIKMPYLDLDDKAPNPVKPRDSM